MNILGETGGIHGWGGDSVRINERFYLGGTTLRGFANGGIGPRDITTDDALGGNWFYRGSAEVEFPSGLPDDLGVRFFTFADLGSLGGIATSGPGIVDSGTLRSSAGAGVSWKSPLGLIRANVAGAITKESYDNTEIFQFNFGTRF
jgi:outer membrane protein insertion porin family